MLSLDKVGGTKFHVIPQVIEAELVVRAVSDVFAVGFVSFDFSHIVLDCSHLESEEVVDGTHPLRISFGQIIIHGDDMNSFVSKGVQIGGKSGDQGFSFPGFHFSDFSLMEDDTAHELDIEVTHVDGAFPRFPDNGKGFNQDIIQ
ncbi:hypothetical protein ES703_61958 [subsurface metagenome]